MQTSLEPSDVKLRCLGGRTTLVVQSNLVEEINCRIGVQMCTLRSQAICGFLGPAKFGRAIHSFAGPREESVSNLKRLFFRIHYTKRP